MQIDKQKHEYFIKHTFIKHEYFIKFEFYIPVNVNNTFDGNEDITKLLY